MMAPTLRQCLLFHFHLSGLLLFVLRVQAQDQSNFISLACGLEANASYIEPNTNMKYISDAGFIDTGVSGIVEDQYTEKFQKQMLSLRSFPQGLRNCYTINVINGTNYIIRANFLYGNYDGLNKVPAFDLYYGVNYWDTIQLLQASNAYYYEIVDVPSKDKIQICVVNKGQGTPFMSAIEIRPITSDIYKPVSGSLQLKYRFDVGSRSNKTYRYSYDIYDRLWSAYNQLEWSQLSTLLSVDPNNIYKPPSAITSTAATPNNASASLDFQWTAKNSTYKYYIYVHFAEVVELRPNQTRSFNITYNGKFWYGPVVPPYLSARTIYTTAPFSGYEEYNLSLIQNDDSNLPPILNAIEVFKSVDFSNPATDKGDVDAMTNIKSAYNIKKWQGDPCAPQNYTWDGLKCSYDAPFRITSITLSSSGLTGVISPSIANIAMLQTLDLSNNSLTGTVPDFLSNLTFLTVLKLDKNNFTGAIPPELLKRSKDGSLSLSFADNPNVDQCQLTSCPSAQIEVKKKKTSVVIPIVASIVGVLVLTGIIICIIFFCKKRRENAHKTDQPKDGSRLIPISYPWRQSNNTSPLQIKGRQFSYSEVVNITNKFERVLGKGGFGVVYYGFTGDIPVAVKILSTLSARGYQQFVTEVNLLMRVHHRNLTTLVGYMNEGTNVGLIYEYMANGNLAEHLSESSTKILTWEDRIRIAMDAALGLEYLHEGCKPPIIHRDVKTTNVLLDETFQAKLSDFGLSKDNPNDGRTHVSTATVAGTPGYLDPEYCLANRLTEKSDVYGFGVVLLEMISCVPVISRTGNMVHIIQWVSSKFTHGDIRSVVDPRLQGNYDVNSVWKAVEVAIACASTEPERRPPMSEVVIELKRCLSMELSRCRPLDSSHSFEMTTGNMVSDSFAPMAR